MSSINNIKNRITTVGSIRKITHAMELVSFSKLKKAKAEYEEVLKYDQLLDAMFDKIFNNLYADELNYFTKASNSSENSLYIAVSSNLGLAGGYNSNIIKATKNLVKENDKLIVIGSYGLKGLSQIFKNQLIQTLEQSNKNANYHKMVKQIVKIAMNLYKRGEISSVNIVYTKYINNLVQTEICEKIYPFDSEKVKELVGNGPSDHNLEFEPSPKKILQEAIPLYIDSKIYTAILNAKISEVASRRIAMENATDNADQLIESLNIEYNRKRQSKITQEIIEIVSGADAV
ncbi:F0F1 ATP synthase subunit gamma [Mycoplasmopsis maculosa]|uniref:ATP synthase gamma chain n=1 Tax=Mycoplasmopsis maculosa TaxID=114885 RepID=A0A449B3I0_9BACT|nr:ATP synthase F1 subunit gamma [Mycoplasmopsis maculosa]VEU75150.1 F0F1 ATP synthase subunit gamma [Mycoplasmopsis maculosa]